MGYVWLGIVAYLVWSFAMLVSPEFRRVSNEIWNNYYLAFLRVAWPYALIFAVYHVIVNGSLANLFRAVGSS